MNAPPATAPKFHAVEALAHAVAALNPPLENPLAEFDILLNALDLGVLDRKGWNRMKSMIAFAIVEANDAEGGLKGYLRILAKWEQCPAYDGRP